MMGSIILKMGRECEHTTMDALKRPHELKQMNKRNEANKKPSPQRPVYCK
jgi:hypothetical protein